MLINDDFHFVDARFEKENFPGKPRGALAVKADKGIEGAVHGAFDEPGHRDQIIDESVVENNFRQAGSNFHAGPPRRKNPFRTPTKQDARQMLRAVHGEVNKRETKESGTAAWRVWVWVRPDERRGRQSKPKEEDGWCVLRKRRSGRRRGGRHARRRIREQQNEISNRPRFRSGPRSGRRGLR